MGVSQFTIYTSSDVGAPQLTGQVGKLIDVLDACLVNGYGSKAAAGWSKPIANASNCGCYKNGTGSSQLVLFVNDNAPGPSAGAKEAWAAGWETIAGVAAPIGSGSGQFPTSVQVTGGHVTLRKSVTADTAVRFWMVIADAHTFHLFISTGDLAGNYFFFSFGDIYSYKPTTDTYRCMIMGGIGDGIQSNGILNNATFALCTGGLSYASTMVPASQFVGHFMARTVGGGGSSIPVVKIGNQAVTTSYWSGSGGSYYNMSPMAAPAGQATPDPVANTLLITPIRVCESSNGIFRGQMRGLYHVSHPSSSFSDGNTFSGAGLFANRDFLIVKGLGDGNTGFVAVETSNTVETN